MLNIDWHQLEKNIGAKEVSFESFNYQIAVKRYWSLGKFDYYYNTPGSEFYLTLSSDSSDFLAKATDVIGWQAKFWLNKKAPDNSPLDYAHRYELVEGFKKSLEYKPTLTVWIICTPGRFLNTAPSYPVDELEKSLKAIKPDVKIVYWYKEQYEAMFHSAPEQYASIFNYYFSTQYLSFSLFSKHSGKRLDILRKRYDTDLYTPCRQDREILSSIFYKKRFDKLGDKIKHNIEFGEKLSGSRLYREEISKLVASPAGNQADENGIETIVKIKELMDELLSLVEALRIYTAPENTLQLVKHLFSIIEKRREKINALLQDAGVSNEHDYEIDFSYEPDTKNVYAFRDYLYRIAGSFLDRIKKVYRLLFQMSSQVFNIFGDAGFGKTNFSCAITERLLSEGLPALLIPASEIHGNGDSIEKQILSFFGIESSISFDEFIGMLDSAGFLHGIKIPIIIDGLNETQPSAATWHPQLQYLMSSIQELDNVILISTCRPAYVKQVFDEDGIDKVLNSIKMEGFKDNLDEAIGKYFSKYNICPKNKDFDRNLFNNPLLLRIFSRANEGKTAEINESNIYAAVESYVDEIIEKVSTIDKQSDPILKNKVARGIARYSMYLWENSSRGVPYKEGIGILPIFDPGNTDGIWIKTISYGLLDEGLLFRNIHSDEEYAEFTHDVIGGFCIAKNVIFNGKTSDQIIETLKTDDLIKKLTLVDKRHPLAEDILKSIVFLCRRYTGKELFELVDNSEVILASLSVVRIIVSREDGRNSFIAHFKSASLDDTILPQLLESVLLEIIKKEDYILTELLEAILIKMIPSQIDLSWSESIRRNAEEISLYLSHKIESIQTNNENVDSILRQLLFISFFLSSTNRYIRDKATKALVVIGRKYPALLFDAFLLVEKIADWYIVERLIAAICGVFLQSNDKDVLIRVCGYLENNYFKRLKTSHVLILDYIDTLLAYAAIHYSHKRSTLSPPEGQLSKWQMDMECFKKVTSDRDAQWGFGPVDYEFAKDKIGNYLSSGRWQKDSKMPTIEESLALVVWRAKGLGYSDSVFKELDIQINKDIYEKRGMHRLVETYGEKYSKIAFHERYGYNLIKGLCLDFKEEAGFRVGVTDIDPTFPDRATKRQLVTCCFLPKQLADIQEWINDNQVGLLENHYRRTDISVLDTEWIMLYGHLVQESSEKSRIDISLYTIIVSEDKSDGIIEKLGRDELYMHLITENSYVIAGEIPWSDNYLDTTREEEIDGENTEIYFPVSSYSRQSKTALESSDSICVISKRLAKHTGLKINLNDFNLYTASDELASIYLHDNYSRYLYMRADLVKKYLAETKQSLVWIELISKYGAFGEYESKYAPSFKDLRAFKKYAY